MNDKLLEPGIEALLRQAASAHIAAGEALMVLGTGAMEAERQIEDPARLSASRLRRAMLDCELATHTAAISAITCTLATLSAQGFDVSGVALELVVQRRR